MAEQPTVKSTPDNAGELRGKLIKRLAVAGVLVAVLLGVLAFFDYLSAPPEEPEEEVYTRPVPVPPKKPVSQPVTATTDLPEPPKPAPAPAAAVETPSQAPAAPAHPESKNEARAESAPPATPPATASRPAPPLAKTPAVVASPAPTRAAPEASAPPAVMIPSGPPPTSAKAPSRVVEARPAPVAEPSGVARLFSGFLLQAGVFTSPQRAEELHARLTLSGVPSTLETRVQVGPFHTRHEAEAAQVKLRDLGIETVLVPPKARR